MFDWEACEAERDITVLQHKSMMRKALYDAGKSRKDYFTTTTAMKLSGAIRFGNSIVSTETGLLHYCFQKSKRQQRSAVWGIFLQEEGMRLTFKEPWLREKKSWEESSKQLVAFYFFFFFLVLLGLKRVWGQFLYEKTQERWNRKT